MDDKFEWDVIVVGGGPAGMMAAGRAAERGARVLLLEKNEALGKKLLITGGGRCNLTNSEPDTHKLLSKFKDRGKYLFSPFSEWGVKETLNFFHKNGVETKIEEGQRVFPVSNSAQSVWNVLVEYMKQYRVKVISNSPVVEIVKKGNVLVGVKLKNKEVIRCKAIVVATGGTSRPDTGSTGDGYAWLEKLGHTVVEPTPSLVPIALKDAWIKRLAGVRLDDIKITILQNGERQGIAKGKILFTHVGVSGPTILNMGKDVGELLKYGNVVLSLDLFPKTDHGKLDIQLRELFEKNGKKKIKNALSGFVPSATAPVLAELSRINPEAACNSILREDRKRLNVLLKSVPLNVNKLLGPEKAIVTSGGVVLDEVDMKTMRSKIFSNLYLVGDILNIDRPSGGYSLQLCWTTGFVAGNSASDKRA